MYLKYIVWLWGFIYSYGNLWKSIEKIIFGYFLGNEYVVILVLIFGNLLGFILFC